MEDVAVEYVSAREVESRDGVRCRPTIDKVPREAPLDVDVKQSFARTEEGLPCKGSGAKPGGRPGNLIGAAVNHPMCSGVA
jgi:hypothetical protein